MYKFNDIFELFNEMNKLNCLILRNYENLCSEWENKTDDIDVLCENREEFVKNTGAILCRNEPNCHNYYIELKDFRMRVDIRAKGDGYYDEKWEKHMLDNRVWYDMFYVMPSDDYYYSLLYHAIIQKPVFSDKYFLFLKDKLGLKNKGVLHCGLKLVKYMKKYNYNFVLPDDTHVALNRRNYRLLSFIKIFVSKK